MPDGFLFSGSQARVFRAPLSVLPRCRACKLCDGSIVSPKMSVAGEGRRRILVVGERPGVDEDRAGEPFVGKSGRYMASEFARAGIDLRRDCWLTNATICHNPSQKEHPTAVLDCRPNVLKAIRDLDPVAVVLAGQHAVRSVIGAYWDEDVRTVGRWVGYQIPCRSPNVWLFPVLNPAGVLRQRDKTPVVELKFRDAIDNIAAVRGKPWDVVPDPESRVSVVLDTADAADIVSGLRADVITFDFETDRIKPDHPQSELVCCSVGDGSHAWAFPWDGPVKAAVKKLLADPAVAKIGANCKFEDRWTRAKLGVEVRGWVWDTVLAAHCLDPRGGVTGLKFQAFVRLGVGNYNRHIEPYLESREKGGNAPNRVREIDLPLLLRYCALDSLLEFDVAAHQMKELGYAF